MMMAQKVIRVVGTSKESFAKAAANAVAESAKTVRNLKMGAVLWIGNGTGREEHHPVPDDDQHLF
jgi:flavin-binding protein dodecin